MASLRNTTILVTRPREQSAELAEMLEPIGFSVLFQPAIEILPPDDWTDVDDCIARLEEFDWIVFSSGNGVRMFMQRCEEKIPDTARRAALFSQLQFAAVGPGTASGLETLCGIRVDLIPEEYRAESLAEALAPTAAGKRFLLIRANRGREILAEQLKASGAAEVRQVAAYQSRDITQPDPQIVRMFDEKSIDWVAVTSSSIAGSLINLFGEKIRSARFAAISPITAEKLRSVGIEPSVIAEQHDMPGLADAVRTAELSE